jgi:hypothetical protein
MFSSAAPNLINSQAGHSCNSKTFQNLLGDPPALGCLETKSAEVAL